MGLILFLMKAPKGYRETLEKAPERLDELFRAIDTTPVPPTEGVTIQGTHLIGHILDGVSEEYARRPNPWAETLTDPHLAAFMGTYHLPHPVEDTLRFTPASEIRTLQNAMREIMQHPERFEACEASRGSLVRIASQVETFYASLDPESDCVVFCLT
ncbi:MAG: hypothetical protein AAGJ10_18425 [Bacteroidota bacterium]